MLFPLSARKNAALLSVYKTSQARRLFQFFPIFLYFSLHVYRPSSLHPIYHVACGIFGMRTSAFCSGYSPDARDKADEMRFCHRVIQRHIPFAVHLLDMKRVRFVACPRLHGAKLSAAAGDFRAARRGQNVAARRAGVKLNSFHIASVFFLLVSLSAEEAGHIRAERVG